jgi:phage N-6-adenine-methyltransferase
VARAWDVLHSSKNDAWRTPPEVFASLNREFGFVLDAASNAENSLCDAHITEEQDALGEAPWVDYLDAPGAVWLNPPYGRNVGLWVRRAFVESQSSNLCVVVLVMACTDTQWWANWAWKAEEIRLVTGRIHFLDSGGRRRAAAPKGSAVLIFSPHWRGPPKVKLWRPNDSQR